MIYQCQNDEIFVFGSNLSGIHGKGAALIAKQKYGAIQGQGWGLQGNSFAIPTKDQNIKTLPLYKIKIFIDTFFLFAKSNPDKKFFYNSYWVWVGWI